jgi:O-methyltransferase
VTDHPHTSAPTADADDVIDRLVASGRLIPLDEYGKYPDYCLTMLDRARLENLRDLVLERQDRPGALVECGVAKGGALAVLAASRGPEQSVWGFDSFEELPALTDEDQGDGQPWVGVRCAGDLGERTVQHTFELLDVPMDGVRTVKGWFEDTLPRHRDEVGPIVLLRLDSDWYESTRYTLEALYDSVVPGGAVVIDDYHTFVGCRRAVDEFRQQRGITSELVTTHGQGKDDEVSWIK